MKKNRKNKGFTLIELIVVMAVIGVLVLLAAPKFLGQTKEAQFTKHITNAKVMEDAAERYYIDHGKWPRGDDADMYTASEVEAYAERIYDITGEEQVLEEGKYWDIDYEALASYAKLPNEDERANYALRNPVGSIYYLDGLNREGATRRPEYAEAIQNAGIEAEESPKNPSEPEKEPEWVVPDYYVTATDADFSGTTNGTFRYIGTDNFVVIPAVIKGVAVTSYQNMFYGTSVEGVAADASNVTDMRFMFNLHRGATLDLRGLKNTGKVTTMRSMFQQSAATSIDLTGFDTSGVTDMHGMFWDSKATALDLSSFDTSKTTNMTSMFGRSKATTIDLSSFDMRSVTDSDTMFLESYFTGTHDARSGFDAYRLKALTGSRVTFLVKDQPATYVLATDADFHGATNGTFKYRGTAQYVIIPDTIKGANVSSYRHMFDGTDVKGVKSTNPNVTNMSYMFRSHQSDSVDLTGLDTTKTTNMSYMFQYANTTKPVGLDASNVTDMSFMFNFHRGATLDLRGLKNTGKVTTMRSMFQQSAATSIDLTGFDTSGVTDMHGMFWDSKATALDLSSFDTSKTTNMTSMFGRSKATTIDLSNFDMRNVTHVFDMFADSAITGPHYARSEYDATRLNSLTPSTVTFSAKP